MKSSIKNLLARLSRNSGPAALIVAVVALVISTAGVATAVSIKGPSLKPRPYGVLALGKKKKFPASAIPKVRSAKTADKLSRRGLASIDDTCAEDSVDMGTYCIQSSPYPLPTEDEGKNNFFFASKTCAAIGGWVPSAGELLGAVNRIKISSTIDDNVVSASVDEDPSNGLTDRREMTSTLVTTAAGPGAAGSQGVTPGSTGAENQGQPQPIGQEPNPQPGTLQYITVYDNHDNGGFAGSRPVSEAERFRCAFALSQSRNQRKAEK